jgi:flagellar biosynthesis/type III secretory pathway M-ring protein FliF/YscJ
MSEIADLVAHLGDRVQQLFGIFGIGATRLKTNLTASFTEMSLQHWIRVVMIVGTYLLLRPYIIKFGARHQEKLLEKQDKEDKAQREADGKISPNQLRGEIGIPDEDEDSDDDDNKPDAEATAASTAADWGKKARKRQRVMLRKILDAEEERLRELQEDEEDKDIEQYLT